jgi:hypothetical protein
MVTIDPPFDQYQAIILLNPNMNWLTLAFGIFIHLSCRRLYIWMANTIALLANDLFQTGTLIPFVAWPNLTVLYTWPPDLSLNDSMVSLGGRPRQILPEVSQLEPFWLRHLIQLFVVCQNLKSRNNNNNNCACIQQMKITSCNTHLFGLSIGRKIVLGPSRNHKAGQQPATNNIQETTCTK